MKKVRIRLSQNIGNMSSLTADEGFATHKRGMPNYGLPQSETIILITQNIIDHLSRQESVFEELYLARKHLMNTLDKNDRPEIFRRFNLILGAFFARQEQDPKIFRLCFEIMSLIKEQIDRSPQTAEELAEEEWMEFEKSVYLLSDWEDQVLQAQRPAWLS